MEIKIRQLWTNPDLLAGSNIVTQVKVSFIGEYRESELNWAINCEDLSDVIPYEDLTEELVAGWIENELLPEHLLAIKEEVDSPPVAQPSSENIFPWSEGE